jgi:hypothetical protein
MRDIARAKEVDMSEQRNSRTLGHRYHAGQAVQFVPGRGVDHRAKGQYTVVRLLPMDGDTPQYRVKNKSDGHERMARENELSTR